LENHEVGQLNIQAFITPESLTSLFVAAGACVMVGNTARALLRVDAKWPAFIASFLISYALVAMLPVQEWFHWIVIAPLNTCLCFCTATGMNALGGKVGQRRAKPQNAGRGGMQPSPPKKKAVKKGLEPGPAEEGSPEDELEEPERGGFFAPW
jgi:hypothetical protein